MLLITPTSLLLIADWITNVAAAEIAQTTRPSVMPYSVMTTVMTTTDTYSTVSNVKYESTSASQVKSYPTLSSNVPPKQRGISPRTAGPLKKSTSSRATSVDPHRYDTKRPPNVWTRLPLVLPSLKFARLMQ